MRKIISIVLFFGLLFQQSGLVYAAGEINLANYLSQARNAIVQPDVFQPARLRCISYDINNNDFKILLDKGNNVNQKTEKPKNQKTLESLNSLTPKLLNSKTLELNESTQELFNYFLIGLALSNDTFWVNLRPDAPENIIDPILEKTDIGKIFLEADLQLKKDTASLTSPQNPEGKAYWDKLYKKAGELFGTENITIPTITRPWIVPNEVIVRETEDSAYIYKATLKVMLEADYLQNRKTEKPKNGKTEEYSFSDPRLTELNEYSSQIIRETIIPKLTKEINASKRYAQLRQVYYSLVLSRWFKEKYGLGFSVSGLQSAGQDNSYVKLIDSKDLTNLISQEPCDKQTYFQAYRKSFKDGEYNLKETVATPLGQSIRSYISGGIGLSASPLEKGRVKTDNNMVTAALRNGLAPDSQPISTASPLTIEQEVEALFRKGGYEEPTANRNLSLLERVKKMREYFTNRMNEYSEKAGRLFNSQVDRETSKLSAPGRGFGMFVSEETSKYLQASDARYSYKTLRDKAIYLENRLMEDEKNKRDAGSPLEVKQAVKALKEIQSGLKEINTVVSDLSKNGYAYDKNFQNISNPLGQVISFLQKKINYLGQMRTERISIEDISYFGKLKNDLGGIQSTINKFVQENSLGDKNGSIGNNFNNLSEGIEKVLKQAEGLDKELQNSVGSPLNRNEAENKLHNLASELEEFLKNKVEEGFLNEESANRVRWDYESLGGVFSVFARTKAKEISPALYLLCEILRINHMDDSVVYWEAKAKEAKESEDYLRQSLSVGSPVGKELDISDIYGRKLQYIAYWKLSQREKGNFSEAFKKLPQPSIENYFSAYLRYAVAVDSEGSIVSIVGWVNYDPDVRSIKNIAVLQGINKKNQLREELWKECEEELRTGEDFWKKKSVSGSPVVGEELLGSDGEKIGRYLSLKDLEYNQQKKLLNLVKAKYFPALIIRKSEILGIGVNGNEILNSLLEKGFLEEIHSIGGFLIVNKEKMYIGRLRRIIESNEDFKKVWRLLKSSVSGAKAIPILEMSHLREMRFAVNIKDKDEWELLGVLQFNNGNKKVEDIMGNDIEIISALDKAWKKELGVSSAVVSKLDVPQKAGQWGGIDLTDRALHIKLERVGSFASTPLLLPQVKNAQSLDLDKEFGQVEALASSGIVPNSHRLLELFTVCHYRGEFGERLNQIMSCLKAASAIQEAQAIDSDEDFRLALMMPEVLS